MLSTDEGKADVVKDHPAGLPIAEWRCSRASTVGVFLHTTFETSEIHSLQLCQYFRTRSDLNGCCVSQRCHYIALL